MKQYHVTPEIDVSLDRMQQCCTGMYTSDSTTNQKTRVRLSSVMGIEMEARSCYYGVHTIDLLLCGMAGLKRENARNATIQAM